MAGWRCCSCCMRMPVHDGILQRSVCGKQKYLQDGKVNRMPQHHQIVTHPHKRLTVRMAFELMNDPLRPTPQAKTRSPSDSGGEEESSPEEWQCVSGCTGLRMMIMKRSRRRVRMVSVKRSGYHVRQNQRMMSVKIPRNLGVLQVELLRVLYLLGVSHSSILDLNLSQFNTSVHVLCFAILDLSRLKLKLCDPDMSHRDMSHLDLSQLELDPSSQLDLDLSQLPSHPSPTSCRSSSPRQHAWKCMKIHDGGWAMAKSAQFSAFNTALDIPRIYMNLLGPRVCGLSAQ